VKATDLSEEFKEDGIYTLTTPLAGRVDVTAVIIVQGGKVWGTKMVEIDHPETLKMNITAGNLKVEKLKSLLEDSDATASNGASRTFDSVFKRPTTGL
jgi:hypothetical protein